MSGSKICIPLIGIETSRIGFGGCPLGQHGWGETHEKDLFEAIYEALENDITLFDTADIYGLGTSEILLGNALHKIRDKVIIATKFGVRRSNNTTFYDNSIKWIDQAINDSLKRLKTDYVDIYQLHYWDNITPLEDIIEKLQSLIHVGKIRSFGVTNLDLVSKGFDKPIFGFVSLSNEYSLANRSNEERIIENIRKLDATFLSWGSLGQGILSGKFDKATIFSNEDRRSRQEYVNFHGNKLDKNLRIVEYISSIIPQYENRTISQIAIRWILDNCSNSIALVGMKNKLQASNNAGTLEFKLKEEHLAELNKISS